MANRWINTLKDKDVTPEDMFLNRRQIMGGALAGIGLAGMGSSASAAPEGLEANSYEEITSYNNYYEFGTGKDDPAKYAGTLTTKPWTVQIDGMVDNPGDFAFDDILKAMTIEERLYKFRCVEAWFETALRPDEMPGVAYPVLDWPYVEGLRLDEAMHPLTIMATGIYGKDIPNQNGAPLRLVVPWKYGFKSIKSVVKITLTDKQPATSWNKANAREYGFYSNVNPQVDHPRWSQASERLIGGGLFSKRVPTLMFNGYEEEVAGLYAGMDLAKEI